MRQPGDVREVRMMLFLGFEAHWTNRSREYPHSRSDILASTACQQGGGGGGGTEMVATYYC